MKTSKAILAVLPLLSLPLTAQDIYKMETFANEDLNGTARFVGMGGAMSSLGADISTMGTNPAGIGLYRRSDIALSGSVGIQPGAIDFNNRGKSRASFDQIGFVYALPLNEDKVRFVNFGFNYHKRRNLKNFIGVDNFQTGGLSQSLEMLDLSYVGNRWLDLTNDNDRELTTPLTLAGYDTQLLEMETNADGSIKRYNPVEANSYNYKRVQWGGIQQYDFNMAINWNDQVYAGLTFGVYNVDIHSYTDYAEMLINPAAPTATNEYYMTNGEALTGSGFDFKFGVIMRPIEDSPFRLGVAIHTPTFYDLTSKQHLYLNTPFERKDANGNVTSNFSERDMDPGQNDYKIRTPWKFNISMATTVGNCLALDAEYEYRDVGTSQVRYPGYDDYGGYLSSWSNGEKDEDLSNEAKRFLKPVSTFRIGAELRVAQGAYLRCGYNYESSPFSKDAYHNLFLSNSPAYYYSCNTDYVNLSAINRVTAGVGLRGKHFYADFAYQYQHQTGDLYTFHVPADNSEANRLSAANVDLSRHQVLFTLGYKF